MTSCFHPFGIQGKLNQFLLDVPTPALPWVPRGVQTFEVCPREGSRVRPLLIRPARGAPHLNPGPGAPPAATLGAMDWSCKSMLCETYRSLEQTELDLGVNLDRVKSFVQHAILEWENLGGKCEKCWGKGVAKCSLCGGRGEEPRAPGGARCQRCLGTCLEQCTACCGYGLL